MTEIQNSNSWKIEDLFPTKNFVFRKTKSGLDNLL